MRERRGNFTDIAAIGGLRCSIVATGHLQWSRRWSCRRQGIWYNLRAQDALLSRSHGWFSCIIRPPDVDVSKAFCFAAVLYDTHTLLPQTAEQQSAKSISQVYSYN